MNAAINGPFQYGDRVLLLDSKQRRYMMILTQDGEFHSHNGFVAHANIVGQREGVTGRRGTFLRV